MPKYKIGYQFKIKWDKDRTIYTIIEYSYFGNKLSYRTKDTYSKQEGIWHEYEIDEVCRPVIDCSKLWKEIND